MVFERGLTLAVALGIIEVSCSNEMVLQMPRIWEQETTPNQPTRQDRSRITRFSPSTPERSAIRRLAINGLGVPEADLSLPIYA
jgi:hypothetical protein